ncbi:MAG: 3'-5' exonuclease [Patescibacteria group bacterium]
MKIAITDLETSGLDEQTHEILEIGLVVFDSNTFEILDTLDIKIKPEYPERFDPEAIRINGYNENEWKHAVSLKTAMHLYSEKTSDAIFCAHNMIFDFKFIKKAFEKTSLPIPFNRHSIDIFTLAWAKISHDDTTRWSLKAICEYLNIPPEPSTHRAFNGAMAEYQVYKKLMQP